MHSDTWYTLYITLRMHGSMVCTRSRVIYACMQNDGVRISKILLDVPRLSIIHPYMGIVHSPVYFISPVDPFHRASRRDGERISLWTGSKLRSRFYPLLAPKGWKKLWKNRVSISFCRNPIYRWFIPPSTVLFCHRKKRYDFYRILVLRFYCTNIGSVLSKLQSFFHATLRALFYHFIAEIRRNVRSKRILTI